jgi:hypothetical protein
MIKASAFSRLLIAALVAIAVAQQAAIVAADDYYDDEDVPAIRQRLAASRNNKQRARPQAKRSPAGRQASFEAPLPKPPLPIADTVYERSEVVADDQAEMVPMPATAGQQAGAACMSECDTCNQCGGQKGSCRCCLCGPPGRFWIRDEYLGFFAKGDQLPALVNTSPTGTLPALTPLFGNSTVNTGYRSGNWVQGGMWLDCCKQWALQGDYFFLGNQSTGYNASSDGDPVLARPYTDANTGAPGQQLIAFPGTVVGSVQATDSNSLQGAGASLRHNLCCWQGCCNPCDTGCGGCFQGQNCARLDFITGFRYYNFRDNLNVTENLVSTSTTNGVPVGTMIGVRDSFQTQNNFYGATLGLIYDRYNGRWVYEAGAQVALGSTQQIVNINGNTTVMFPGQTTSVAQGGLLALSSNIGHYTHNSFAAIPMFSGRIGYRLSNCFTAFVGYTFIYWGEVARAGSQVNTTINPNLLPPSTGVGPAQPAFSLHESTLWVQGITLGGQFNF